MTYLLILVTSLWHYQPNSVQVLEFSSKTACESALNEHMQYWRTVEDKTYCISTKEYSDKLKRKAKLEAIRRELNAAAK